MNETSQKIDWQRFIQALTNEDAAFNFPIKYPAIDLDKSTKQSLYLTAGIIAGGFILGALIYKGAKSKR